ncbi:hypothetical protein STANM309S_04301 [Streptomyces tanashiensis]
MNGAGDVMITVALASTVFFSVPTDEARGRVALYLAVTMAPFTLLAPVIGPLLDRIPHGAGEATDKTQVTVVENTGKKLTGIWRFQLKKTASCRRWSAGS